MVTERSILLRKAAIHYYSNGDHISCLACGFDFYSFYGEIGKGFIEIHHKKPLFKYEDEDDNQFLSNALERVAPLCSNCHRMIHRKGTNILDIEELIKDIETLKSQSKEGNIY